jgi:hypothetical protein
VYLSNLILRSAESILRYQCEDGSFPAGHNGPYFDKETPVRNTAHWAITLCKAHNLSRDPRFQKRALLAQKYLLSEEARPYGAAFLCRRSRIKDCCNGLIGQAWAADALTILADCFGSTRALDVACEVLLHHEYAKKVHLWHTCDVSGESRAIDITFNHQLWFAAIAIKVGNRLKNSTLINRAGDFFQHINETMVLLEPGLIRHEIPSGIMLRFLSFPHKLRSYLFGSIRDVFWGHNGQKKENWRAKLTPIRQRSIEYLPFNLYGFALAYDESKDENWWTEPWLQKVLRAAFSYIEKGPYYQEPCATGYGWPYNPIGFEVAYALHVFQDLLGVDGSIEDLRPWVNRQIGNNWNPARGLVERNTDDPAVLSARLYEATRLPDMEL